MYKVGVQKLDTKFRKKTAPFGKNKFSSLNICRKVIKKFKTSHQRRKI